MKNKAFTLLEITVVITIITLLSTVFIVNYRGGEQNFALKRSAHLVARDLRRAEEMAMSAKEFQGSVPPSVPPGGYGVYFSSDSRSYILFADLDNEKDYDGLSEKIEEIFLEKGVKIKQVAALWMVWKQTSTVFTPPDPAITNQLYGVSVDGTPFKTSISTLQVTLCLETDPSKTKTITVNKVGLIDIE